MRAKAGPGHIAARWGNGRGRRVRPVPIPLRWWTIEKSPLLPATISDATRPHPRAFTHTARPAAFGFLQCSLRLRVEKTGRDRGVRKAPRFLPSLAFRSGGGLAQPPSADVRVGSRRRRAEAGRHRALGAWGCRVGSHHPRPPKFAEPTPP